MKIKQSASTAAGKKGIFHALRMVFNVTNPVKGIKTLNKVNQKNGVDCPGCAWPDPTHRSKLGEYCENGAKAIAEEIMDADDLSRLNSQFSRVFCAKFGKKMNNTTM